MQFTERFLENGALTISQNSCLPLFGSFHHVTPILIKFNLTGQVHMKSDITHKLTNKKITKKKNSKIFYACKKVLSCSETLENRI